MATRPIVQRKNLTAQDPKYIEYLYTETEFVSAGFGRRMAAHIADTLIIWLTLGVGWLVWMHYTAKVGRTPGKSLFKMYIVDDSGALLSYGQVWVRELLIKQLLFGGFGLFLGILWFVGACWSFQDAKGQALWDKMVKSHVGKSMLGFVPPSTP